MLHRYCKQFLDYCQLANFSIRSLQTLSARINQQHPSEVSIHFNQKSRCYPHLSWHLGTFFTNVIAMLFTRKLWTYCIGILLPPYSKPAEKATCPMLMLSSISVSQCWYGVYRRMGVVVWSRTTLSYQYLWIVAPKIEKCIKPDKQR